MDSLEFTDSHGDQLRVVEDIYPHRLIVAANDHDGGSAAVFIPRDDAIRLRDWLDAWLAENGGYGRPAPLTAADVRAIAAEVVGDLLARQNAFTTALTAAACTIPDCGKFPGVSQHFEHDPEPSGWEAKSLIHIHDPEPRDVGHPAAPVTLSAALADPTPVSLDALWSPPAVITPECGLCKAPWSDGHGQPGDPCTGAPKQLVGCECGHGWGTHTTDFPSEEGRGCAKIGCPCKRTRPPTPDTCECGHRVSLHDSRGCPSRQAGVPHKPCPCTVTR